MDMHPTLEVRNLKFPVKDVPRHWHGGKKAVTTFFDNLSIFFPEGERFFVEAVKAHKALVTDPALLKEVASFCAQEGIHSREHVRYNEMLEAQGYPAARLDRKVGRILRRVRRVLPKRARLSVTCALEHFTALMGDFILRDPRLLEGAHPAMRELWRWHAAEEFEHKTVPYDVYNVAGNYYVERAIVMLGVTVIFWALVIQHQWQMMKADGTQWSLREWRSLFVFLFVEPGGMPRLWRRWLDYFRPSFHPSFREDTSILHRWRAEHASSRNGVAA